MGIDLINMSNQFFVQKANLQSQEPSLLIQKLEKPDSKKIPKEENTWIPHQIQFWYHSKYWGMVCLTDFWQRRHLKFYIKELAPNEFHKRIGPQPGAISFNAPDWPAK